MRHRKVNVLSPNNIIKLEIMANTTNKKPWGYGNYITYSEKYQGFIIKSYKKK